MDKYNELKEEFEANRNDENATKMAAYMRNLFVFYGLPTPKRKSIYKEFLRAEKTKNPQPKRSGFLAERWGFEPQNAFDTLHDFQSCALDQLSHLSTSSVLPLGGCPWRSTIIPESRLFVKDFFEKKQTFLKKTKKREKAFCRMDGKHKST